ncbi:MAG: glycosyltransferase family 2 protein, partial [Desulfovibrionaceae bacterium]
MHAPSISVLMPCRNAAHTVDAALGSVLAQTGPPLEVVAVDDGSSDATPDVLDAFAQKDPRVRVLRQ